MNYKTLSQYSITFDDVLLSPGYSTIKPKDVNTSMSIGDIKLQMNEKEKKVTLIADNEFIN